MPELTHDDYVPELPDSLAKPMLEVILAFARLDSALSAWLIQVYGMPLDRGALLVENFDLATKINRLRRLYLHDNMTNVAAELAKMKKLFEKHKEIRNTIAHATYAGALKGDPDIAIFSPIRAALGKVDNLEVVQIHKAQMVATARWAARNAEAVMAIFERSEGRLARLRKLVP